MRAVAWQSARAVQVVDTADPVIREPTDAIIRVTATGICGSDLHLYDHGAAMRMRSGDIVGHEAMGEVVEVGGAVSRIGTGDRVVVPFNISCGQCAMCGRGLYSQCLTTRDPDAGTGGALLGYTHLYGGVPGGQAEYLRVPQAQFGPIPVEAEDPPAVLMLSDVLPAAWEAVERAEVPDDGTLVVFGLGPVGQMCVTAALYRGAGRVIVVDRVPERLAHARRNGAESVDFSVVEDVPERIRDLTSGGADSVIDAVGMDADGSFAEAFLQSVKVQPDRFTALRQAIASVRRGGTVSVIGVYSSDMLSFPLGEMFDRQITLRWGLTNVRGWDQALLGLLRDGDQLGANDIITHVDSLENAPDAYERFKHHRDGVIKTVLSPVIH